MPEEKYRLELSVNWLRPNSNEGPWHWGKRKDVRIDTGWAKRNVLYRWVRNSDQKVAMLGETERTLTERVDNYLHAREGGSAGSTNKRLRAEQARLNETGDFLYIEYTDLIEGYDLADRGMRRMAEALLTGLCRPYLKD